MANLFVDFPWRYAAPEGRHAPTSLPHRWPAGFLASQIWLSSVDPVLQERWLTYIGVSLASYKQSG